MPELPEVETVRRVIEPQIQGRRIDEIILCRPEIIDHPTAADFCAAVVGQSVCGMERRGKFLTVLLADGARIILHLRMTGCLLVTPCDVPPEKHTHILFRLSDGTELRFSDPRRFGRFWLIRPGEADTYSGVRKLGLEPFDPALTAAYLIEHVGRCKRAIKECLLDQSVVAGIGNIYADEILFATGLHPHRRADSLTPDEWGRLATAIPERLGYYIEMNRISPQDYLIGKGQDYRNTPYLQVYGHAGEACPVCGETLCRAVFGGRSSVYCPDCQAATSAHQSLSHGPKPLQSRQSTPKKH